MKTNELIEQRELLSEIAGKLEAIKFLWLDDSMPSLIDLEEYSSEAGNLLAKLESVKELWGSDELPALGELEEYARAATDVKSSVH